MTVLGTAAMACEESFGGVTVLACVRVCWCAELRRDPCLHSLVEIGEDRVGA